MSQKKIVGKKIVGKKIPLSHSEKSLCAFCKKKLLTLPFQCKFCSLEFCDAHRLPEDHSCLGLAARKEQLRARLQRGERVSYEPRARKEIDIIAGSADSGHRAQGSGQGARGAGLGASMGEERYGMDLKAMTDPLVKSPLAIIGMVVAAIAIAAILFLIFR